MIEESEYKKLVFVGSSRDDIRGFPRSVREDIGYALYEAQIGRKSLSAKPLKGFRGAGVLEIISHFDGDTYRSVYTIKFQKVVYVLHCFKKKSKRGIKTPQKEMDLVYRRLAQAKEDYLKIYEKK